MELQENEESSFHSETYSNEGKVDIQTKIANMQDNSGQGNSNMMVDPFFLGANCLFLLMLVTLIVLLRLYQNKAN